MSPKLVLVFFLKIIFDRAAKHVGSLFPAQGLNLRLLRWKGGVLTTGPPGNPCPGYFRLFLLFGKHYDQNKFGEQSYQGFCWKLPQICVLWRTIIFKILSPSFHDYGGSLHSSGLHMKTCVVLSYFVVLNNVLFIFSIKV